MGTVLKSRRRGALARRSVSAFRCCASGGISEGATIAPAGAATAGEVSGNPVAAAIDNAPATASVSRRLTTCFALDMGQPHVRGYKAYRDARILAPRPYIALWITQTAPRYPLPLRTHQVLITMWNAQT